MAGEGLNIFGTHELVEVPNPNLGTGGDIDSTNDAAAKAPLGILFRYKGNVYRYVQFDNGGDNVAAVDGAVVHWKTLTPSSGVFLATSDYSSGLGKNCVAGVLRGVVTDQYYTWIQVGGVSESGCHGSTVAGDLMIYDASNDKRFDRIAADSAVTAVPFGVALEADSANFADVLLMNLMF